MIGRSLVAATALLTTLAVQASASPLYSAIYAFGDSLSDTGNLFDSIGLPAPPYSNGRFSNGPVWVEDLSQKVGLGPVTPSVEGGNDYAWGEATTGYSGTLNPAAPVPTLADQVGQFLAKGSAPPSALYTFSIGANDLFQILGNPSLTPSQIQADLVGAADTVATAAGALESSGARKLVLLDVPNLGLTPAIMANGPAAETAATALAYTFNGLVQADLAADDSGLTVYTVDAFDILTQIVNDPKAYGFTYVNEPCWTGTPVGYAGPGSLCSLLPAVQDQYLFWDDVHPTEAGHLLVADAAYALITPEPSTWAMMIMGLAGTGLAAMRRARQAKAAG